MARSLGSGLCSMRCTHGRQLAGVALVGSLQIAAPRDPQKKLPSLRIVASDATPKRESSFPQKLLLKSLSLLRQALQSGTESPSTPASVNEELEPKLGRLGESDDKSPAANSEQDSTTSPDVGFLPDGERYLGVKESSRAHLTSPGFSFSAAGHLFPYHLGVSKCLIEHGYISENTPLAGSSAGALVCAVVAGGLEMSQALDAAKEVSQDCRANGTAFRVGAVLRGIMNNYLPDDIHIRVNGRIRVAVTQLFRQPRGLLVDHFESKEDLINALHTSCYIPGYFARNPITIFRERICIDGGFTLFMPPTSAEETIRICPFFPSVYKLSNVQISPDCNPIDSRPNNQTLLNLAFVPAEDDVLDELFLFGYEDASSWVRNQSL